MRHKSPNQSPPLIPLNPPFLSPFILHTSCFRRGFRLKKVLPFLPNFKSFEVISAPSEDKLLRLLLIERSPSPSPAHFGSSSYPFVVNSHAQLLWLVLSLTMILLCKLNLAFLKSQTSPSRFSNSLCLYSFSVMVKLMSSVAAWIFVLELDSLDLNRKSKPLSPPSLLSCMALLSQKTLGQFLHFFFFCLLLLNVNV